MKHHRCNQQPLQKAKNAGCLGPDLCHMPQALSLGALAAGSFCILAGIVVQYLLHKGKEKRGGQIYIPPKTQLPCFSKTFYDNHDPSGER